MFVYLKSIGSLVLFLAALYYSITHQREERKKAECYAELCTLFAGIEKGIECYTLPLGEIYRSCYSPLLAEVGFLEYWHQGNLMGAAETLKDFSRETSQLLRKYAENAGTGNKENELQLCRNVRTELEEKCRKQKTDMLNKNKLYRTLPFLLVISVVLLMA